MRLSDVFRRDTRVALWATPGRKALVGITLVAYIASGFIWPGLVSDWGWLALTVIGIVAFAFLASHWANKDALARDQDGTPR